MNLSPSRRTGPLNAGLPLLRYVALAVLLATVSACERQKDGLVDTSFSPAWSLEGALARSSLNLDSTSTYVTQNADGSYEVRDTITASVRPAAFTAEIGQLAYSITRGSEVVASGLFVKPDPVADPPQSGLFSAVVTLRLARSQTGTYAVEVSASASGTRRSVLLPLTISKTNSAPVPGLPNIRQLSFAAAESVKFFASIAVTDSDGLGDIVRVEAIVHGSNDSASALVLADDGNPASGDLVAGDGIFSTSAWIRPTVAVGGLVFEFRATDAAAHVSTPVFRSLLNHPPHILALDVPDSVQRPATGSTLISFFVTAADSEGLGDIDSVYFYNAGATAIQNILMYDDGNILLTGDSTAGDGVFSRIVRIDPTNSTGTKEFHFLAVDRLGARDEAIKNIVVY